MEEINPLKEDQKSNSTTILIYLSYFNFCPVNEIDQ